jgi:hypothetical protein
MSTPGENAVSVIAQPLPFHTAGAASAGEPLALPFVQAKKSNAQVMSLSDEKNFLDWQ